MKTYQTELYCFGAYLKTSFSSDDFVNLFSVQNVLQLFLHLTCPGAQYIRLGMDAHKECSMVVLVWVFGGGGGWEGVHSGGEIYR